MRRLKGRGGTKYLDELFVSGAQVSQHGFLDGLSAAKGTRGKQLLICQLLTRMSDFPEIVIYKPCLVVIFLTEQPSTILYLAE